MKLYPFIQFNANQHINTNAEILYFDSILLNPTEWYTQISNVDLSGQTLKLIDCNNIELQDVLFFNDEKYFEFTILNTYYQEVRLKVTIDNIDYISNPFVCYEEKKTLRLDYKYKDYYQSIRLNGYFTTLDNESNVSTYVEQKGRKLSGFSTITDYKNFKFDNIDNHTFKATNQALAFPDVYINFERCPDKPLLKGAEDVEGSSNFFSSSLKGCIDVDDVYNFELQIAPRLVLTIAQPQGLYTPESFINAFFVVFNHEVTENSGVVKLYKDDEFVRDLEVDLINGGQVNFRVFAYNFTNGNYKWIIPANKFNSFYGSHQEIIINFVIQNPDFDNNDFNSDDFFSQ
jgi:hypothetical protein